MREIQKYRYGAALVLTVIIFLMGVMFSSLMDHQRSGSLQEQVREDLIDLESNQLQLSYLRSDEVQSCDVLQAGLQNMVLDYNRRLGDVQNFEEDSFFNSEEFGNIKHRYILSGIRYWMFAEELRESCDYNPDNVLFFTTALNPEDCSDCQRMGDNLILLKRQYGDELLIFSIPTGVEDGMIDVLMKRYNVTETPTIVINGEEKMEGYHSRAEIEERIQNYSEGEN